MLNLISYVEDAVKASPDLEAAGAKRYHQQWMLCAFSTLSLFRRDPDHLLYRREDDGFFRNIELVANASGLSQDFIRFLLHSEIQTFVLTDTFILEMNPHWTDWLLWICQKIIGCYFNELPKFGFERNDLNLLVRRLTDDTSMFMLQHVFYLYWSDLQVSEGSMPS